MNESNLEPSSETARQLLEVARAALERIAGEIPHASARRSARRDIARAAIAHIDAARAGKQPESRPGLPAREGL